MPKQKRWVYKRECDYALNALARCQHHINRIKEAGYDDHPDFIMLLVDITDYIGFIETDITRVKGRI